nr:hypothetical protein [Bordetella pertussis]
MTARDPLAAIRARLAEVTACWQAAESLAQIRASFADYLAEVGPRGAAMARPGPNPWRRRWPAPGSARVRGARCTAMAAVSRSAASPRTPA